MKKTAAVLMLAISGFLFVEPASAAGSQIMWPRHHHRHHGNQCKNACKEDYKRCKRAHGKHCKALRHDCERGCPR